MSPTESTYHALLNEADFTCQMLGSGATQIGRASYASKGIYFQAFSSLSTGLERLGKLCLMLDHFHEHGRFPDLPYMRREIGHHIVTIHARTEAIVSGRGMRLRHLQVLTDPVHLSIIELLSAFAVGDRYSNIDLVVGKAASGDPIGRWFSRVDNPLFADRVTDYKKAQILHNAQLAEHVLGSMSAVFYTTETGDSIQTLRDASIRTGVQKAVAPYRQLYVLQVIRYWVDVLWALERIAWNPAIPGFGEIFARFNNTDSIFRGRTTWERD